MATQIQLRRDTEGDWNTADPTLAEGEIGLIIGSSGEITGLKVGDGNTRWEALKLAVPMLSGVANILEESDSSANQPVGGTGGAGDVTTFLLKGLSAQNAAVFGIEEASGTDLVLSIDKTGGITAAAGVNVSGGYGDTGLTVEDDGTVKTNSYVRADGVIESGTYATTAGDDSGAQLKDNTDHGQLLISSNSSSTPADDTAIHVNTNAADAFIVKYDGDVTTTGSVTATGVVSCADPVGVTDVVTKQWAATNLLSRAVVNEQKTATGITITASGVGAGTPVLVETWDTSADTHLVSVQGYVVPTGTASQTTQGGTISTQTVMYLQAYNGSTPLGRAVGMGSTTGLFVMSGPQAGNVSTGAFTINFNTSARDMGGHFQISHDTTKADSIRLYAQAEILSNQYGSAGVSYTLNVTATLRAVGQT